MPIQSWVLGFNNELIKQPTGALRPIIPNNARTPRITAAAGTELAGAFFLKYRHFFLPCRKGVYNP